jgi:general secretion pathway protein G
MLQKKLKNEKGMTLIEILIVIALIAMVGTFATVSIMGKFDRAKVDSTKIQIRNLGTILDLFKQSCGFYPLTDQGLEALISKPTTGRECPNYDPEGYLKAKKPPKDGWNRDFIYTSDGNTYVIRSLGADGVEGGEGVNADISSEDI